MKDFIISALPFVIMGICIAILFKNKRNINNGYESYGMVLGMSFGVSLAPLLQLDLGLGISLGMLIGLAVGSLIKKENENDKNK